MMQESDEGQRAAEEAARIINQGRSIEISLNEALWLSMYFALRLRTPVIGIEPSEEDRNIDLMFQAAKETAVGRFMFRFVDPFKNYPPITPEKMNKKETVVMTGEELEMIGKDLATQMELSDDLFVRQAHIVYQRLRKRFEEAGEGAVG